MTNRRPKNGVPPLASALARRARRTVATWRGKTARRLASLGLVLGVVLIALPYLVGPTVSRGRSQGRPGDSMVSTVVYPPQRITIRMDHSLPAHRRLRCAQCHDGATQSTHVADRLIPREAACAPCHDEVDREQATAARCGLCHVEASRPEVAQLLNDGGVSAVASQISTSSFPTARLHFSHQDHARAGVRCLDCHQGITSATLATRAHLPSMQSCWRCHGDGSLGNHQDGASSACNTCHLSQPNGQLQTQVGGQSMLPPRWLHGMDHDRDFLVRHRWVAADRGDLCAQCHQEDECVECHDGRVRMTRVHRGDFLTTHGPMARRNETRCASCHTTQRFCTECHARLGLAPVSASAIALGGQFHPSGWSEGAHALEAQRSMTTCTSCHVENDCVVCHGASGIGAGLSPHPANYVSRCAADWNRNRRACRTCHGAADLGSRCD